jgi:hypothetical protein
MANIEANESWRERLSSGVAIPAFPLALNDDGSWSQRHQRALARYYHDAGAGGLAVGVHSTQFEIREPQHDLYEPVLRLAAETLDEWEAAEDFVMIAGICGNTNQALAEVDIASSLGYHAGLLSLAAMQNADEAATLAHCRRVAEAMPVVGFYLQPAVGGRVLSYEFWRGFFEIEGVVAVKIAPFNRYQTWDVVRAVIDAGRDDVTLYTGNDDNIIADLLTPFSHAGKTRRIIGGLLGQWAVWTSKAAGLLGEIQTLGDGPIDPSWLQKNAQLTDANAAVFDAANSFSGCIPGIMEVLRRQGLVPSARCLDAGEKLSPGQSEELDRVIAAYPWLVDDEFVSEHLERWLFQNARPTDDTAAANAEHHG